MKGFHISISGIDGSGKSTQGKMIEKWIYENMRTSVIFIDGIKPCKYSNLLRQIAKEQNRDYFEMYGELAFITFALDLIHKYEWEIKPLLEEGYIVITHRNDLCCKVYSRLRDYNGEALKMIDKLLLNYSDANLYLHLKVNPEEAMNRINKRVLQENYIVSINENIECLTKLDKLYSEDIKRFKNNVKTFDTTVNDKYHIFNAIIDIIREVII